MSVVDQLVQAGYPGYQGWDDAAAMADFNATQGAGKGTPTDSGSGNGGVPAFGFDYAQSAKDAYGELGPYYDKLISESKGDINLAMSRLIQDYDTGVRQKTASAKVAQTGQDISQNASDRQILNNANARGLYTRSNFDPTSATPAGPVVPGQPQPLTGGFGIPDATIAANDQAYGERTAARNTDVSNYLDEFGPNGVKRQRATTDAATNITRKTEALGQQRTLEAGNMANQRGQNAYQDYLAKFSGGG